MAISKPLAFIEADEEVGKGERDDYDEYEDSLERLQKEIDEKERQEKAARR